MKTTTNTTMAKLKNGRGKKGPKKAKTAKTVVLDEITLGSSDDESVGDSSEVMEVDEHDDKENDMEQEEVNSKETNVVENSIVKPEEKPISPPIEEEPSLKNDDQEPALESESLQTPVVNGDSSSIVTANGDAKSGEDGLVPECAPTPVVNIVEPPWPLVSPRPGFILSAKEFKDLHLVPRVALVPLKHDKLYHLERTAKLSEDEQQEDLEVSKFSHLIKEDFSNVIQLGNDVSAVIQPNGDSLVLPTDFKRKLETRRKRVLRWMEESSWTPPKLPADKKLYIGNVKFGRSISKTKLTLSKIDPKAEIQRVKNVERSKRYNAQKRAQLLAERQQELQTQRSQNFSSGRTPIVKNGKVVGYAVQYANQGRLPCDVFVPVPKSASNVPASNIVLPSGAALGGSVVADTNFPDLEDYSLLEPEIIMRVSEHNLVIKELVKPSPPPGSRQVVINGKLLTLVPFNDPKLSPPTNPTTAVKFQHLLPKTPVTIMRENGDVEEEAICHLCNVKLPKSILAMHKKMRHQSENKNNNADEIEIVDDDDDEEEARAKSPTALKKSLPPPLIELNPESLETKTIEEEEEPMAILP